MVSDNLDDENISDDDFPSWTPELGERLSLVLKRIGTLKDSAAVARVSDETLANWRDGKTPPNIFGLLALCNRADVRLDWVVYGDDVVLAVEPKRPTSSPEFDQELMTNIISWQREDLDNRQLQVDPREFARLCMAVYRLAEQQRRALREANVDKEFTPDDFAIFQELIRDAIS